MFLMVILEDFNHGKVSDYEQVDYYMGSHKGFRPKTFENLMAYELKDYTYKAINDLSQKKT